MGLQQLGEKIDAGILRQLKLGKGHADAAFLTLKALEIHKTFDLARCLEALSEMTDLPKQLDPGSRFGEPPVTFYSSNDVVCELYFWRTLPTAIHTHTFNGAFVVLAGGSVHSSYDFDVDEVYEDGAISTGDLRHTKSELLEPGDVRAIHAGDELIHRVNHLLVPSLTLIVRCNTQTQGQFVWGRHLMLAYTENLSEAFHRKLELLKLLRRTDSPHLDQFVSGLMQGASEHEQITHFLIATRSRPESERLELFRKCGLSSAPWGESCLKALQYDDETGGESPLSQERDVRLVFALGTSRAPAIDTLSLLRKVWNQADIGRRLLAQIQKLRELDILLFELNDMAQELFVDMVDKGSCLQLEEECIAELGEGARVRLKEELRLGVLALREQAFISCFIPD